MSFRELDLNLMPVLDALLTHGSVSRAGEALGMTQPTMSHALRRLRVYFNDPLFVRSGARMVATQKALELAPVVAEMMEGVRARLVPGAGFDPAQSRRVFSLSMTDMAELVFMPRLVPRLRERAPHARLRVLRLMPRELPAALERRDIDLAIGSLPLTAEGLYQQQLVRHPLVCIVSRDNPRYGERIAREAYLAAEHIGVMPFGRDEDIFEWALQAQGLKRRFFMMTQGFLTLPMLIEGSDLIATVPEHMARVFGTHAGIRCLPPPVELPALALRQSWHPRFQHDPGNAWLRALFFETFSADRAG